MAQYFGKDEIGAVAVVNTTTVSLGPSRVLVGGSTRRNAATVQCDIATVGFGGLDTGTKVASNTYYLFAVKNGLTLALVASLSATAPTGYAASKCVARLRNGAGNTIDFIEVPQGFDAQGNPVWPERKYALTVTGTQSWATQKATGIPYQRADGSWHLRAWLSGDTSSVSGLIAWVAGVQFKQNTVGVFYPIVVNIESSAYISGGEVRYPNTGNIVDRGALDIWSNINVSSWHVFLDLELEAKPTWAA